VEKNERPEVEKIRLPVGKGLAPGVNFKPAASTPFALKFLPTTTG
jgi:hypothetical protein